jgi:hypothetical protein
MQLHIQNAENLKSDQTRQFLELSEEVEFADQSRGEIYAFRERGWCGDRLLT